MQWLTMLNLKIFFLLIIVFYGCHGEIDINKYLKTCNRNSVDVNDCLVEAVQKGIAAMADGILELGTPPIDPFFQKEYVAEYKNNQISVKMNMKNIYVAGLKAAKVHDVRLRADDDRFHMEIDLTSRRVYVKGEYSGRGQFNALKLAATGTFNVTMSNLVWTWKLDGVPEKNGSETYVRIKEFYMRPDLDRMVISFINDNPESKDLTDLGTNFVNENWRVLYRELVPYAQTNWKAHGITISNQIFLTVPYDKLFPTAS